MNAGIFKEVDLPVMARTGRRLGAAYLGGGRCCFGVWAPGAQQVTIHLLTPNERFVEMQRVRNGYWEAIAEQVEDGSLYVYRLDGKKERPDPASRFQPDGVHGPSMVVAPDFAWDDAGWTGLPLDEYVIYELHVGTFTPEGTLDAIIQHLPGLRELGITAVELMPLAQFPGTRNWGYDGVDLFAVQNSYGGPRALHRLVNAAHREGLAIILDVVYNHLGAEGNYLGDYGPYFTDGHKTPWGSAINHDGPHSDHVRRFFIENALFWQRDFHIDALRLDAVHAIFDFSAHTMLEDLAAAVARQAACTGRPMYLIAEDDRNETRALRDRDAGRPGLDAGWNDDFHHAIHALLTLESHGYYQDYVRPNGQPTVQYLAKALREGHAYTGQYSRFRKRRHGSPARGIPGHRFVVFTQNHDQIGNRMLGERLSTLVSFNKLKLAAGILALAPYVPLLFMGEEYGETNPFLYFVSHGDPELIEAVRTGRRAGFASFVWQGEPPDPAAEETFLRSKLCRQDAQVGGHSVLRDLYRELLRLRRTLPALRLLSNEHLEALALEEHKVLFLRRWAGVAGTQGEAQTEAARGDSLDQVAAVFNFGTEPAKLALPFPAGRWHQEIDSAALRWQADDTLVLNQQPGPRPRFDWFRHPKDSAAPDRLDSDGSVELVLSPLSFVLYLKDV